MGYVFFIQNNYCLKNRNHFVTAQPLLASSVLNSDSAATTETGSMFLGSSTSLIGSGPL